LARARFKVSGCGVGLEALGSNICHQEVETLCRTHNLQGGREARCEWPSFAVHPQGNGKGFIILAHVDGFGLEMRVRWNVGIINHGGVE
jgi:hypothetical protein